MINIIVDTSVFMLPQKQIDPLSYFKKFWDLNKLNKNYAVTLSYMNNISDNLGIHIKIITKKIQGRNITQIDYENVFNNLGLKKDINFSYNTKAFENYLNLLRIITSKQIKNKKKNGKIGIFENIPERDIDPGIDYEANDFNKNIYLDKNRWPLLFSVFKNYLGYIAFLNKTYGSSHRNFLLIGDVVNTLPLQTINVKSLNVKKGYIVNIVGFNNLKDINFNRLYKSYNSLSSVIDEAKERFSNQIEFGKNVNHHTLDNDLKLDSNDCNKVFLYLETLSKVVKLIKYKYTLDNIDFNDKIVELMNAHGLLCSPEDNDTWYYYKKYKCKERTFDSGADDPELFNYHLKPLTSPIYSNNKNTVRIYIMWKEKIKKIWIGYIGKHPSNCAKKDYYGKYTESNCPHLQCRNYLKMIIDYALDNSKKMSGNWIQLANFGATIKAKYKNFDPNIYGYQKLLDLIKNEFSNEIQILSKQPHPTILYIRKI